MRFLVSLWVTIKALAKVRRTPPGRRERIIPPGAADPGAETLVAGLLLAAALCGCAFVVVYIADVAHATQLEGLTLGGGLLLLAAALIVTAQRLVVTEQKAEPFPEPHPQEQEEVAKIVTESGSRLTRKKLLGGAAIAAGTAMGAALVAPVASFGPALDSHLLLETPWRRGRRLVSEDNTPVKAADIEAGTFYTAFAEGASHDVIGAPVVVVRVDPKQLKLPRGRRGWAPGGIVAYSKVCTHAGCAIALYRKPTFPDVEDRPALICPCHYSTFDPATGGAVLFGPAGRDLPQLPLQVDPDGHLRAAGNFSGPPGPSWWGVRLWKARFARQ